jgi:signal transduction histidine kinase
MPDAALITGDADILTTVVRNLLTNAVKFTNAGGTVTLDVSPRDCRDVAGNVSTGGYIVSVSDTGVGMSREQIGKLFIIDSAHSRKGTSGEQGSGLGLIVCREMLAKHGTTLHVESEEGKGSRFWFEVKNEKSLS